VRQVARDPEHEIMVLADIVSTFAPSRRQNPASRQPAASTPTAGVKNAPAVTNSSENPASGPEFSMPATGWAARNARRGDVGDMSRQDRAFDRADVRHDRARRKMRVDFCSHRATGRDRNGDNDEVCAFAAAALVSTT